MFLSFSLQRLHEANVESSVQAVQGAINALTYLFRYVRRIMAIGFLAVAFLEKNSVMSQLWCWFNKIPHQITTCLLFGVF